jgi:hypothetical protein
MANLDWERHEISYSKKYLYIEKEQTTQWSKGQTTIYNACI